jgi:hypothetical protein
MGYDDDQVAHWFRDQWKALGVHESQADKALAASGISRTRRSGIDGIVYLLAIRKNHQKAKAPFKRGDLFEIILIQIKGGGAKWPDKREIKRLRDVAKYYNARDVVLAEWVKGNQLKFNWLVNYRADPKKAWGEVDPGVVFR